MSKIKSVTEIRTRSDAVKVAEQQGCQFRHGKHLVAFNDRGACAFPHKEELCTGTRRAIIKTLLGMGLTVFLVALPLVWFAS